MDEALFTYLPVSIPPRFFILAFTTIAMLALSWRLYILSRTRRQLQEMEQMQTRLSQLLNLSDQGWILWSILSNTMTSQSSLLKEFKINLDQTITLSSILNCFSIENVPSLEKRLTALRDIGEEFVTDIPLHETKKIIRISGKTLDKDTRIIWLRDVTNEVKERTYQALEITSLLEERNRFCGILNSLPFPIWARSETGQLLFCNGFYANALNSSSDQVIAKGKTLWTKFMSPTPKESEAPLFFTQPIRHHVIIDGSRRLLEFRETKYSSDYIGFAHDLTEIEIAQNDLKRHIEAHHDVLEEISVGITIYGPDRKLKFFNHAYSRLFDMDEKWLHSEPSAGDVLEDLRQKQMLPEIVDFPAYKQKINKLFTSLLNPFQHLDHLADGRTIRMVTAPHPMGGIFYIFEDVTDKLELERQYNTLIAVQQTTLNNLYEGVAVFGSNHRLKLHNPAFERMWNLRDGALEVGQHISTLVEKIKPFFNHKNNWESYKKKIITYVTDRIPKRRILQRQDGSTLELSYVPLPDGSHMMSYSDITDRMKAEQALRERSEALQATDKLKSEFIATITDELRSPLNEIVGNTEILNSSYVGALNSQQKLYTNRIRTCSQNLMTLVSDIIDLASIEAGHMKLHYKKINIFNLLKNAVLLFEGVARKAKITIKIDCTKSIGHFFADEKRMKQVLYNLLTNSIKFTNEGGKINLKATREADKVVFTLSDTGIGIAHDDQFLIFKNFVKTASPHRSFGNSVGLGLPLVKNIINLHGGTVKVSSKPQGGTTITYTLPIGEDHKKTKTIVNDNSQAA